MEPIWCASPELFPTVDTISSGVLLWAAIPLHDFIEPVNPQLFTGPCARRSYLHKNLPCLFPELHMGIVSCRGDTVSQTSAISSLTHTSSSLFLIQSHLQHQQVLLALPPNRIQPLPYPWVLLLPLQPHHHHHCWVYVPAPPESTSY